MTEPANLDPSLRNRLLRYIHTGNEVPKYYPGCWSSHNYFDAEKLPALNEALETPHGLEVVKIILQAGKDGWYTRFETIAFALAKCLLLGSPAVKEATYKAATAICITPEQLMLFNKYTRLLKTGNGRGWCKGIQEWYMSRDPMELAREMTRVRARHGRSHKTLLRKSHFKTPDGDYARDAVIKYAILGLKRTKQLLGDKEEAEEVLKYIQKVDDIRHCEDPPTAALSVTENKFTLDHVPGHLLTSQDVWNAVLPQLPLSDLLCHIQRLHNMGFLTDDSMTTAILASLLLDQDLIKKSKVTSIEVYIAMCNYKNRSRPLKHEKAKVAVEKEQRRRTRQIFDAKTGQWEWTSTRRHPKEIKNWGIDQPANRAILVALNKLYDLTWNLTPPTNVRYLITMDMRHHMFKGRHFCKNYVLPKKGKNGTNKPSVPTAGGDADAEKKSKKRLWAECFYNNYVTPGHAAITLALQLLKREKEVKIAVFTEEGIELITLEPNFTGQPEAEFILRNANNGRVQLDAPILWADTNNQKVDVFVNMVDRSTRYMELEAGARGGRGAGGRYGPPPKNEELVDHCPVRALMRYREKSKVKDAKLIVLNLASHRVATTDGSHEGVLDIVGIDEHVPKLMDAFALGQFK